MRGQSAVAGRLSDDGSWPRAVESNLLAQIATHVRICCHKQRCVRKTGPKSVAIPTREPFCDVDFPHAWGLQRRGEERRLRTTSREWPAPGSQRVDSRLFSASAHNCPMGLAMRSLSSLAADVEAVSSRESNTSASLPGIDWA